MIADAPGIRALALRLQTGEISAGGAALCIALGLAAAALLILILSPKGDK